ncbi:MAG: Na+/H+ antiporter subunit E [Legionellaceae bacterium]|nr:Na+/H+ antiporter subunit E [Legionellaceae bacterium]
MPRIMDILKRIGLLCFFTLFIVYEIIKANLRVAWDVLTPGLQAKPGLVYVPLDCSSDNEITLLGILISLTPGTLTLDVSEDKKKLLIHVMYLQSEADFIRQLKANYERPIREIFS